MEKKQTNGKEKKVLRYLAQSWDDMPNCYYFRTIAVETKLSIKEVRRACRSLAKKGLTEYVRGLFDEEGFTAGSGYCATKKGANFLKAK